VKRKWGLEDTTKSYSHHFAAE